MPLKFAVSSEGKDARTNIEKVRTFTVDDQELTQVNVYPKTGRTHQIRIHLTAIKHPVIGDNLYNTKRQFEWSEQHFQRLMLHAVSLKITHPITKSTLKFESPLPDDFKR